MKLIIVTPEKIILEKEILQVTVPTSNGEITILKNHENLISTLSLGNIVYLSEDKNNNEFITIDSGFLKTDGIEVKILADIALNSSDYEEQNLLDIKENAIKLMENAPKDANIEKLKSQIKVADLHLLSKRKRKI